MNEDVSLTLCIQHLQSPNRELREEAARVIWQRYSSRLRALIRRRLDDRVRRREDEDDVLQCMYLSFWEGQMRGSTMPASRQELWKLLVRITMCKLINTANRHTAARRDVRRETISPRVRPTGRLASNPMLFDVADRTAGNPLEEMIIGEELNHLLRDLPSELRSIAVWKLEGYTSGEIAGFIGRTVRSVELKMHIIRKRLVRNEAWAWLPAAQRGAEPSSVASRCD